MDNKTIFSSRETANITQQAVIPPVVTATVADVIKTTNTTPSTSTTTGALQVAGGAGIAGALFVGGNIFSNGTQIKAGTAGYAGSRGPNGYNGSQGNLGYAGSIGAGFVGSRGPNGYNGSVGANGTAGAVGFAGSAGTRGYSGSAGGQGTIGFAGSAGYSGSQGSLGYAGSIGSGYTGSASLSIGYTALTANVSRTITTGNIAFPVNTTANLTAFSTGQRVRAANVFANIVNGVEGTISSFSGNIMYIITDTEIGAGTFPSWVITAAPGPQGSQGEVGPDGAIGPDGYAGSAGYAGSTGYAGSIGGAGYTGSASTVIGYGGSKGYTGSVGAGTPGYTGSFSFGFTGSKGFVGSAGSQGTIGFTGSAGSLQVGNLTASITTVPGQTIRFTSNLSANSSGNLNISVLNNEVSFALPDSMKLVETVVTTANVVANISLVTSNIGNISSNITPNWAVGSVFNYTLKANANVFIPDNMPIGSAMTLVFTQDTVGSRTMKTYDKFTGNAGNIVVGTYFFAGNIRTLSTAANTIDMMNIVRVSSTQYLAALSLGYK